MIEVAQRIVDAMKLDIDVRRRTGDYDFSKRQSIEIARACLVPREVLAISAPLVLLDEPTSALEKSEEDALFGLIRSIREHGSVLFVSHRLSEVLSVCDVIHVLKDGRLVATVNPADIDESTLHGLMVGRERDADYYHEEDQGQVAGRPVMLEVRDLSLADHYRGCLVRGTRRRSCSASADCSIPENRTSARVSPDCMPPEAGTVRLAANRPVRPDFRDLIAKGSLTYRVKGWRRESSCHSRSPGIRRWPADRTFSQLGWAFGAPRSRTV